jgi:hypothetical protein
VQPLSDNTNEHGGVPIPGRVHFGRIADLARSRSVHFSTHRVNLAEEVGVSKVGLHVQRYLSVRMWLTAGLAIRRPRPLAFNSQQIVIDGAAYLPKMKRGP